MIKNYDFVEEKAGLLDHNASLDINVINWKDVSKPKAAVLSLKYTPVKIALVNIKLYILYATFRKYLNVFMSHSFLNVLV